LYSSLNIIRQIKPRRMKWDSLKKRDHSEYQGADGRMGLEWILGRMAGEGGCGTG
jgi:hypothetical protein